LEKEARLTERFFCFFYLLLLILKSV